MKYVALFRGINVNGHIVKMDMLKQLFQELGFLNVQTYIQSGNVIFEADFEEAVLKHMIQNSFLERFGFKSNVILRSNDEMAAVINQLPFSTDEIAKAEAADSQVEHLYIYFLDEMPKQTQIDDIYNTYEDTDILQIGKRELYLLCHPSIRKSKLAIRATKVFDSATARNWSTVNKLYDMMKS